jgi:hypothetical protein
LADHSRTIDKSAGREWFLTHTRFLDEVARTLSLHIDIINEASSTTVDRQPWSTSPPASPEITPSGTTTVISSGLALESTQPCRRCDAAAITKTGVTAPNPGEPAPGRFTRHTIPASTYDGRVRSPDRAGDGLTALLICHRFARQSAFAPRPCPRHYVGDQKITFALRAT